jgi:hypothetical protein
VESVLHIAENCGDVCQTDGDQSERLSLHRPHKKNIDCKKLFSAADMTGEQPGTDLRGDVSVLLLVHEKVSLLCRANPFTCLSPRKFQLCLLYDFRKCVKKPLFSLIFDKCVKKKYFFHAFCFFTHFQEKTKLHVPKKKTTFFHLFFLLVLKMVHPPLQPHY